VNCNPLCKKVHPDRSPQDFPRIKQKPMAFPSLKKPRHIIDMSTNGQLVFTDVDKITFKGVGNTSNAVVDTVTGKIGVGIDSPDANLHVLGNSYVSTNLELGGTLIMGTVNVSAHHSLEAVTAEGNTTPLTIEFSNATTGIVTTGNVEVGNELTVSGNVFFTSNVTTSVDSNVVMEHAGPHGRLPKAMPLRKYPEIVFDASKLDGNDSTNTYVQAGYTVTASSDQSQYNLNAWRIFDGVKSAGTGWASQDGTYYDGTSPTNSYTGTAHQLGTGTAYGEWLKLELPKKIKVSKFILYADPGVPYGTNEAPKSYKIYGSVTGSSWTELKDVSNETPSTNGNSHIITDTTAYRYVGIVVTQVNTDQDNIRIGELEFYGHEEDPPAGDSSLDATFKSVLNTPQTTGANVYVDGNLGETFTNRVTGPTLTGTATTYNETGKYWELTGALTSNVTVEGNTFLEGDQPHAVSVWFNSSNLEANTANTCVFSISDQEHLNSQNLDLQSNTWHNLTYSYQGEGGSRVTYLDGRKVAEDQAEDTFGDYPPFAMTGYSQGGYVVSASSEVSAQPPWQAFDDVEDNYVYSWQGVGGTYSSSTRLHTGGEATTVSGTSYLGDWIQIEFPYKMYFSYVDILPMVTFGVERMPGIAIFAGSNDATTWTLIRSITKNDHTAGNYSNYILNSINCYKYIRIIWNELTTAGVQTTYRNRAAAQNIKFYGHRENDLVRLPDPTHVLKYPHLNFTNHGTASTNGYHATALRGYVVSASTKYSSGSNTDAWRAFDGVVDLTSGSGGQSWDSATNTYASSGTGRASTGTTTFNSRNGEWINVKFPHKVLLTSYQHWTRMDRDHEGPYSGYLYGSNDGFSTFQEIHRFEAITLPTTSGGVKYLHTVSSSYTPSGGSAVTLIPYNEYRLQVTHTQASPYLNIALLEFYGTGVDSIPIQIGGGNIDKVANFRVYDKFVEEDQALEIWDAQKDEFGRAKSSMTLHKGRLGIGTTEPEGRLAVADEPDPDAYGLQEYPPKPLVGYKTHIEGHGIYKVSISGVHQQSTTYPGWKAFNDNADEGSEAWITYDPSYNNGAQTLNKRLSSNTPLGEYIVLEFPYKVKISLAKLHERGTNTSNAPSAGVFYGSNDGVSWTELKSFSGLTYDDGAGVYSDVEIDATEYFNRIALVVTNIGSTGSTWMGIGELRYFGYREQVTKQSVLHDGQLTLTKNLDVPRIGPALDADDTPRRDRLVVEYNTSINPTFEGAVRDTSGRGNDAVLLDGAYYDATEKALDISAYNGSAPAGSQTAHIKSGILPGFTGNQAHTMSFWFKGGSDINGTFATLAPQSAESNYQVSSIHYQVTNNRFKLEGWGNDFYVNVTLYTGTLYHVALTYEGSTVTTITKKLYINGVQQTNTTSHTEGSAANFTNTIVCLGERSGGGDEVNGQISNFKLYDCALTAQEVKTLYDMGRCDEGHHVVNFSKTRVGIGLGDGEAPTYTLDVRGQIRSQGSLVTSFTGQHRCFPDEPVEKGLIVSAKKNRFVKLNGFATGQEAITIDESLPIVSLSNVAEDKACFGVVSSIEKPTPKRIQITNGIISDSKKKRGDNRAIVNSVGEGAIWVVNTGGPLESGDYITTSNVAGYGQKQDGAGLMNYTVAKITMDCDFEPMTQPIQIIKKDEEGENVLDEHGQLQWEDHPTETEKAYKVRYLTADGTQTEVSNAVHIAAFVGCTYHCG
jgi:hypothetical protein